MSTRCLRIALYAALCLASAPGLAAMRETPMQWRIGDQEFSGMLVYDDAQRGRRPGLVMFPNWMGVGADALAMARTVAGRDYVVLVADVYGRDVRPRNDKEALAAVRAAYGDGGKTLRERAARAVETLRAQAAAGVPLDAGKVGALGFCFGGGVALELVRSGAALPGGVVSFHGNLDSYRPADGPVRTAVLVLNGADDTSVTAAQIAGFEREMKAAGADWQFVNFGGARHCFSQPEDADQPADSNCRYDERAAKRAFEMARDFFRTRFKR